MLVAASFISYPVYFLKLRNDPGNYLLIFLKKIIEPSREIMALFVLRKLVLQTRMRSNPVGLDV